MLGRSPHHRLAVIETPIQAHVLARGIGSLSGRTGPGILKCPTGSGHGRGFASHEKFPQLQRLPFQEQRDAMNWLHCFQRMLSGALAVALVTGLAVGHPQGAAADRTEPAKSKHALLVGVNKYAHADLNKPFPLEYAEADVTALKELLEVSGYEVVTLRGADAKLARIRKELSALRRKGSGASVVLAAFAGHGIQPEESKEAYFCPYDADQDVFERNGRKEADWDITGTMLPLSEVLTELRACGAESKAILVDACRNDPKTGRGRGFGTQFNAGDLPENLALLLSCSRGERAWEDQEWGHGAFFHHVLTGIRDKRGAIDGHVTANSLIAYVNRAVREDVPRVIGGGATQRPHAIINGEVDLQITLPKARRGGEVVENSLGMKLVVIPAGEFQMGGETVEDLEAAGITVLDVHKQFIPAERPVHRVRISKPFLMGQAEVARGQFRKFVAAASYQTEGERDGEGGWGDDGKGWSQKPEYTWLNPGFDQTDDHPVVNVSWNDAVAFCQWLSKKEGKRYRLPTEAEWEYACRGGTKTRYWTGDDPESLAASENVADASSRAKFPHADKNLFIRGRDGHVFTAPVGSFDRPNPFGLYDMQGNVCEWCSDWYDAEYYAKSPAVDPKGPSSAGSFRVIRGGGWDFNPVCCRSANRLYDAPSNRVNNVGFRLVCEFE